MPQQHTDSKLTRRTTLKRLGTGLTAGALLTTSNIGTGTAAESALQPAQIPTFDPNQDDELVLNDALRMSEVQSMPYDERDDDTGRFRQEFADEDFLTAVREGDLPTTREVADAVGCKYRTAYARLSRLEDTGHVASRTVGNSLVWRVVDDK